MKNKVLLSIVLLVILATTATYLVETSRRSRVLDNFFPPAATARPNIIVIIADDLGWEDVGVYGNASVYTPNIDQLAAGGLRFDNAFLTTSSCSASRASILTGKYPHSDGLPHLHQSLPADQVTLGQLLREGGYYTASVGKWHIGGPAKRQFSKVVEDFTDSSTERWQAELRQRPKDKPFFFWLASRDPHPPHTPSATSVAYEYDPEKLDIPRGFVDGPGTRRELADYYREVTRFDRDVGLVVAELDSQGILDDTLLIVMSDNGRPFNGAKETLYDEGIKTPFIVHWPRVIGEPAVRPQLISMVDLAPTLLDLASLPVPEDMQGYSFAGILTDPDRAIREYVYAERNWHFVNYHERAVRSLRYLYKENQFPLHGLCNPSPYAGTAAFRELKEAFERGELHGPEKDCFAKKRALTELMAVDYRGYAHRDNLANRPGQAQTLETMRAALHRWREDTGDFDYTPYTPPVHK